MKITLKQWLTLEEKAREAGRVLQELMNTATELVTEHHKAENKAEVELLLKVHDRAWDATQTLAPSLFHVQSEWTGGDSSNPRNTTLREPNLVTISHSFPREQVDKYRNEDGEIVIPHRNP